MYKKKIAQPSCFFEKEEKKNHFNAYIYNLKWGYGVRKGAFPKAQHEKTQHAVILTNLHTTFFFYNDLLLRSIIRR